MHIVFWFEDSKNSVQGNHSHWKIKLESWKRERQTGEAPDSVYKHCPKFWLTLEWTTYAWSRHKLAQLKIKELNWDLSCHPRDRFQFACNQVNCLLKQINQCSSKNANRLHTTIFIFTHSHDTTQNYTTYEEPRKCNPFWSKKAIIWD